MHQGNRGNGKNAKWQASERRERLRRRIWWGVIAVAGVAALGAAFTLAPESDVEVSGQVALGRPAPDIAMTDFDGERFELADYEGKPLVVNFWASWCPNCVAEMPDFEKVHQESADKIQFLGINQNDSRGPAQELARETGVTYRLAWDPRGQVFNAFGGPGMPTTVFIDADGNVIDVVVGQLSADLLRNTISEKLGVSL